MRVEKFPCPACKRPHALCVLTVKSGKQVLGVNCDDSARLGHTRFVRIPQNVIDVSDFGNWGELPQYVTPTARQESADKENLQLILMHTDTPFERTVDLPRESKSDKQLADEYQAAITKLLADQEKVNREIAKLISKRTGLENDEREFRRKLKEVFTIPLDFKGE